MIVWRELYEMLRSYLWIHIFSGKAEADISFFLEFEVIEGLILLQYRTREFKVVN